MSSMDVAYKRGCAFSGFGCGTEIPEGRLGIRDSLNKGCTSNGTMLCSIDQSELRDCEMLLLWQN